MKIIDHKLKSDSSVTVNFVKTESMGGTIQDGAPRFLIMHYTVTPTAAGAIRIFQEQTPGKRKSAHLVIDHDGTITQMVPFNRVAWHAGESQWKGLSGINSFGVGIEVVNWGYLKQDASGGWRSDTGASVPASRVIVEEHKHEPGKARGWELFDAAQKDACVAAAKAIVAEYGMSGWDLVGHEDISPRRKVDPGPAFDMDLFRANVFGEEEDSFDIMLFKVQASEGLNLRAKAGSTDPGEVIKKLPNDSLVHVIDKSGLWWLVAEIRDGNDDVTGFVHSRWLTPA